MTLNAAEVSSFKLNGNAINSINSKFNGSIVGGVYPTSDRFGKANSAMYFKGAGYIKVNGMKNYNFGKNVSISLWVKRDTSTNYQGIISNGYYKDSSFEMRMGREQGGTWLITGVHGKSVAQRVDSHLSLKKWHHLVLTSDSYEAKLYVDNVLVSNTLANIGTTLVKNSPLIIGANGQVSEKFYGAIDDVKIFTQTLNRDEVDSLYKNNSLYKIGYQLKLTNKNNITTVNEEQNIPSNILIKNISSKDIDAITWSELTFPSGDTIYKNTIKKYTLSAESETSINVRPIIYSWYPKGKYIFKYYLANKNIEGGNIIFDSFTFVKE